MGTKGYVPSPVRRILIAQLGATCALALAVGWYGGGGYSALLGGTIYTVANVYAGWRIFSLTSDDPAYGELYNIYRAEFGKLVLIGALCALTFMALEQVHIVAFIGGMLTAVMAGAIAAMGERPQRKGPQTG